MVGTKPTLTSGPKDARAASSSGVVLSVTSDPFADFMGQSFFGECRFLGDFSVFKKEIIPVWGTKSRGLFLLDQAVVDGVAYQKVDLFAGPFFVEDIEVQAGFG